MRKFLKNENYHLNKCLNCEFIWQQNVGKKKFLKELYENYIDKKNSYEKSVKSNLSRKSFFMFELNLL